MLFQMGVGYGGSGFNLYSMMGRWQEFGFYDIVLPFILIFTIAFGVLQKVKIFGAEAAAKKINLIVSLVIAFLFLQNHYLIFILQRFLPNMSIIIIVALMFLLIFGIFAGGHNALTGRLLNFAFILSVIVTLAALTMDFVPGANNPRFADWFMYNQGIILLAIAIIAVVFWVGSGGNPLAGPQGGEHGRNV